MRPLQLRIEAFGSYAGVEHVDFEALGRLGLFLVTGPTGSGKTTIFDALVFALYGTVPGSRRPEEVHSHHAPPRSTPRVVLELEADGTRWRIERTAKHERPARRGDGTTTEQPTAAMWRWQGGEWVAVASGLRDVNAAVVDRIGLTAEQFQRVVLLPQGDFEQFLVARSDDRKVLLRQLFGTELYERAVEHLRRVAADARAAADAASARHRQQVDALVHHLEQAELLTGSLVFDDAPMPERLVRLERSAAAAEQARERAEAIAAGAERELAAAEAVAQRWSLRERRREERDRLAAGEADHRAAQVALDAARRARAVVELAGPCDRHQQRAETAAAAVASARARLASVLRSLTNAPIASIDDPAALRRELHDGLSSWRRRAERWGALSTAERAAHHAAVAVVARRGALESADVRATDATALVATLEQELAATRAAAAGLEIARAASADAARGLRLATELERAVASLTAAVSAAQAADDAHRGAFDRFLQHAAPRLAAQLQPGDPCPVCGAVEHPRPAHAGDSAATVSAGELDRLRLAAGDAAQRRDELAGQVAQRRAELGSLADTPLGELEARAAAAALVLASANDALHQSERAEAQLADARRQAEAARTVAVEAAAALAVATAEAARCQQQQEAIAAELVGVPAAELVDGEVAGLEQAIDLVDAVQEAEQTAIATRTAAAAAVEGLAAAVAAGGWTDADEALAAALPEHQVEQLERAVEQWEHAWQAVTAQLAADDAELPEETPDVAALAAFASEAAAARQAAAERHTSLAVHIDLARSVQAQLDDVAAAAAGALAAAELAATVHERCAGHLSPKVSLESWVLGVELDRVVDAANGHLEEMTSGRYRLARVTDTTDARVATGLDLVVDDAYTGTSRRTTSLSGGERFQASLALALGLADVVTAGASATARTLDALFVDEGFGSLDAGALDQAIATLDRLRVHGRQIGVITHVEAMQSALPIGIRVERLPGEAGSRIVQPVTAG